MEGSVALVVLLADGTLVLDIGVQRVQALHAVVACGNVHRGSPLPILGVREVRLEMT